jgi:tetraacyldisaccharide 4'-kinase
MRATLESFFLAEWQQPSLWQLVLRPVSWLFGALAALRRALFRLGLFRQTKFAVPVIVVGNITAGGTGKTPLVIYLAEFLEAQGFQVGVITRGYAPSRVAARTFANIVSQKGTVAASDEALMMSQRLKAPVFANASRVDAARALLKRYPNTRVILSDDGLQHYALGRDIEIALVDGARGFGNGALMPSGPLREPPSRLAEVDAVVINGVADPALKVEALGAPVFAMALGREQFFPLKGGEAIDLIGFRARAQDRRVHAVAGIGNNARFFAHLQSLGVTCAKTHDFPDHHPYLPRDLALPEADMIVMTEKDAVKCRAFADERMWFMRVDAVLPPAFEAIVLQKLATLKKL